MLKLPHGFAIGFRYGHSRLRATPISSAPEGLSSCSTTSIPVPISSIYGSRPLEAERAIDWPYFIDPADDDRRSNKLDTLVASDVFDLPESAVPDAPTKFLGNLPQRNLIRSREIGLTRDEKLFDFYFGRSASGKLTPDQVEPDKAKRPLFELQPGAGFQTPLWYYILKEAELSGGLRLGKLGRTRHRRPKQRRRSGSMAGGWTRDGAVLDQIEDTIIDGVLSARARLPAGEGTTHCVECGEEIPEPRRRALPGARTCVPCQSGRDGRVVVAGINRRGSKDSQLR